MLEPGTYTIIGRVAGTTLEPKATVTVKPAPVEVSAPARTVEAFALDRGTLNPDEQQRATPFMRHRDKFIQGLAGTDPDRFLYMFRDAFGEKQPATARPLGGWDSQTTRLRGHATGHYLSAIAQAYASTGYDPVLRTNFLGKMNYLVDTLHGLSRMSGQPPHGGGAFNADPTAVPPGSARTNYDSNLSAEGTRTDYWNWRSGLIMMEITSDPKLYKQWQRGKTESVARQAFSRVEEEFLSPIRGGKSVLQTKQDIAKLPNLPSGGTGVSEKPKPKADGQGITKATHEAAFRMLQDAVRE